MKKAFTILASILVASTSSLEYWQCENGSFCTQDQTCINNKCYPGVRSILCVNGASCPENTYCNTIDTKCEPERLYWQIDAEAKFFCPKSHTACMNSEKDWRCTLGERNVCCSDGSACPENFRCNLDFQRCDPIDSNPILAFLEEVEPTKYVEISKSSFTPKKIESEIRVFKKDLPAIPKRFDSIVDLRDFEVGFIEGIKLYNSETVNLYNACRDTFAPEIQADLSNIINNLRNLNIHSDFLDIIRQVVTSLEDIRDRVKQISQTKECQLYQDSYNNDLTKIRNYLAQKDYFKSLAIHSLENIQTLVNKSKTATNLLSQKQYHDAGFAFGDLINFIGFWNFHY